MYYFHPKGSIENHAGMEEKSTIPLGMSIAGNIPLSKGNQNMKFPLRAPAFAAHSQTVDTSGVRRDLAFVLGFFNVSVG